MNPPEQSNKDQIRLQCYAGAAAPAEVLGGWRQLQKLPDRARRRFWTLLGPALSEPPREGFGELLSAFCREDELAQDEVLRAVQACRLLLEQASALDLSAEGFAQDLAALSGANDKCPALLLERYPAVKADLRARLFRLTLAEHGKVLTGVDWRIDVVNGSNRGVNLNASVVFLTLAYQEGRRSERITLQLTSEAVADLKKFWDRFGTAA